MAVKIATLSRLSDLEREMGAAGRQEEEAALREVLQMLVRSRRMLLTTGEAAARLNVSIPTVKRWIERGTLDGGLVGSRWLVSPESVQRVLDVRKILGEIEAEGFPTDEEIRAMYARRDPITASAS